MLGRTTLSGVWRIAVAEDEAVIRMDLVETLRECGYEVVGAAGDGESALELVERERPDVALVDIAMPGVDGLEVTRLLAPSTAVVVVTAFGQRDLIDQAVGAGAMAYLVKPVGRLDLVPAIEVAAARWAAERDLREQVDDLSQRLADRRDVDRAKGLLMSAGLSEPEAYARLRQRAMDSRASLGEVARQVIAEPDS